MQQLPEQPLLLLLPLLHVRPQEGVERLEEAGGHDGHAQARVRVRLFWPTILEHFEALQGNDEARKCNDHAKHLHGFVHFEPDRVQVPPESGKDDAAGQKEAPADEHQAAVRLDPGLRATTRLATHDASEVCPRVAGAANRRRSELRQPQERGGEAGRLVDGANRRRAKALSGRAAALARVAHALDARQVDHLLIGTLVQLKGAAVARRAIDRIKQQLVHRLVARGHFYQAVDGVAVGEVERYEGRVVEQCAALDAEAVHHNALKAHSLSLRESDACQSDKLKSHLCDTERV
mmetsp:Transcript_37862/g.88599  ORF Transcript_37862/g.88599 Transcript_37862/m.88599 type:complete len:292 (+) Transcript_37862:799-1674(+)|eukprot:CAMPEP_0119362238 /NCGR_PEP_ID=MMETSP1334-20130426/9348_1 /TAXON_ID=127549 /ORGANISM="Calcidiscus leptoporus, Strain RCC1130" /LENGTH=291 /DNA_ID=CAMNT_0007377419 /DNA_START=751 /DNA_END=1626 /DNA_ORIENTATION=+